MCVCVGLDSLLTLAGLPAQFDLVYQLFPHVFQTNILLMTFGAVGLNPPAWFSIIILRIEVYILIALCIVLASGI